MNCAKCPETGMRRLAGGRNPEVWGCPACGGVWVPDGRASGATVPPQAELPASGPPDADSKAGLCPAGHGILARAKVPLDDGFYLDRCAACSGVWFDQGEWHKVAAAGLTAGLFVMWTEPWQRKQREATAAETYERRLTDQLGSDLVEKLEQLAAVLREHPARSLALGFLHARIRE